jgi:hypothetical protein
VSVLKFSSVLLWSDLYTYYTPENNFTLLVNNLVPFLYVRKFDVGHNGLMAKYG